MEGRTLPADATEASRVRHQIAVELARACPPDLGREIALTGSVSRGLADDESDIELKLWVDEMPRAEAREGWLRSVGATDIAPLPEPDRDGTSWVVCRSGDVRVEAGWQTIDSQQTFLRDIVGAEIVDHRGLIAADAAVHAIPLSSNSLLQRWQDELVAYPDTLQQRLIATAAESWEFPHVRWALARRGERFALAPRLLRDVQSLLRILFALNRQWEPEWKWIEATTSRLSIKPERLVGRIDEIFSHADAEHSVEACMGLIVDTLTLVPPPHNVSDALASAQEQLRARAP